MSITLKTYLSLDPDTKKGTWSGSRLVYGTQCDIYIQGYGSAVATQLELALHWQGTKVAYCNTFVDNGDGFYKGTLDLDTDELQDLMENKVEPEDYNFVVTLHDTTNDSCYLNDFVEILSYPFTGRQGNPTSIAGTSLSGSVGYITSGTTITALTVLRVHTDWYAYPQNSSDATLSSYTLGIALNATTGSGETVQFVSNGILINSGWSWTRGAVFYTSTGVLTQTVPTVGFVQPIGFAFAPTKVIVNIGTVVAI